MQSICQVEKKPHVYNQNNTMPALFLDGSDVT